MTIYEENWKIDFPIFTVESILVYINIKGYLFNQLGFKTKTFILQQISDINSWVVNISKFVHAIYFSTQSRRQTFIYH